MSGFRHPLVTLSGLPGSGTTTAAKLMSEATGYRWVNTGQVFRDMARERGLSLNDFGKLASSDSAIDQELDRRQIEIAKGGGVLLEGRLAGYMAKRERLDCLAVWLAAPLEARVRRVSRREGIPFAEAMRLSRDREQGERARYLACYCFDMENTSIYDLVLDSTQFSPEQIRDKVLVRLRAQ